MIELDRNKIKPIRQRGIFLAALNRVGATDEQRIMAKILYSLVGFKSAIRFIKYVWRHNKRD